MGRVSCTVSDIFAKIPALWHWAFVIFRLGIFRGPKGIRRVAKSVASYPCPGNYWCGAIAVYAFRTLGFPSGISQAACFVGNKSFTLHMIDCIMLIFGNSPLNMLRYWELQCRPTLGILNLCLSTLQFLFVGMFFEIYSEGLFAFAFEFLSSIVRWTLLFAS
jgi:hypothetical protein